MLRDADVKAFRISKLDSDVGYIIKKLALQVTVFIAIIENPKGGSGLDIERDYWHDNLSLVEVEHWQAGSSLEDDVDVFERFL